MVTNKFSTTAEADGTTVRIDGGAFSRAVRLRLGVLCIIAGILVLLLP